MRLTTRGRYAVMAMLELAKRECKSPVCLADVAARQGISVAYLEQLFARLRRAGLVESVRGPGGGYRLAQPAARIHLAQVMLAVNEPLHATRCVPGRARGCTADGSRCDTHDVWEALGRHIYGFLASVSLSDVLAGSFPCLAAGPHIAERAAAADGGHAAQVTETAEIGAE